MKNGLCTIEFSRYYPKNTNNLSITFSKFHENMKKVNSIFIQIIEFILIY